MPTNQVVEESKASQDIYIRKGTKYVFPRYKYTLDWHHYNKEKQQIVISIVNASDRVFPHTFCLLNSKYESLKIDPIKKKAKDEIKFDMSEEEYIALPKKPEKCLLEIFSIDEKMLIQNKSYEF